MLRVMSLKMRGSSFICMGMCERARASMARLSSSVHSIILIGFIRELKSNTSSVCLPRAARVCAPSVRLYLCACVRTPALDV